MSPTLTSARTKGRIIRLAAAKVRNLGKTANAGGERKIFGSLERSNRHFRELLSIGTLMIVSSTTRDSQTSPVIPEPVSGALEAPETSSEQPPEVSPAINSGGNLTEHTWQSGEKSILEINWEESPPGRRARSWPEKFRDAFRGVFLGVWGQNSFLVHSFFTIAALVAATVFQISLVEWLIVGLCIVTVWTAEMFNSALERLARAVNIKYDPHIRDALDIGSGAVLVAALGAATIGGILFFWHFLKFLALF